jgi:hypothetical protein
MTEPRIPTDADTATPIALRRRVKRGIVASYIHDISERHGGAEAHESNGAQDAAEPTDETLR